MDYDIFPVNIDCLFSLIFFVLWKLILNIDTCTFLQRNKLPEIFMVFYPFHYNWDSKRLRGWCGIIEVLKCVLQVICIVQVHKDKGNNKGHKGHKIESWSVPILFNSKDDKMATSPSRISRSYGNFYSGKVHVLPIGLCSAI